MAPIKTFRVTISPRARARSAAFAVLAFLAGVLLSRGLDHRDWNLSTQWTKVTTVENVATGERTLIQEQSGSTESRTSPTEANAPGATLFGASDDHQAR